MSSNINIRINNMEVDYVVKRNGSVEEMKFDKINNRLKKLSNNLCINSTKITQKICNQIYPNIKHQN